MKVGNKPVNIERTFGMGVLLKLTKTVASGIEISTDGERFSSNVSLDELSLAVDAVLEKHRIKLKTK